jgi:hypothetical protein
MQMLASYSSSISIQTFTHRKATRKLLISLSRVKTLKIRYLRINDCGCRFMSSTLSLIINGFHQLNANSLSLPRFGNSQVPYTSNPAVVHKNTTPIVRPFRSATKIDEGSLVNLTAILSSLSRYSSHGPNTFSRFRICLDSSGQNSRTPSR